jgi:CheY-like chemotaxis protein
MTYLTHVDAGKDTQEVTFVQSAAPGSVHEGLVVPWSQSLCKQALEHGPRRTNDIAVAFGRSDIATEGGLASYIVEPVHAPDGQLYGTLCGASPTSRPLGESDSATLRMYARLLEQKLNRTVGSASAVVAPRAAAPLAEQRHTAEQLWESISSQLLADCASEDTRERRADQITRADQAWDAQRTALRGRSEDADHRLRVVVADDQRMLREVLAAIIGAEENLRLVGSADSAWSTVGVVAAEQPDILVLDYELGDARASDVIGHVRTLSPGTRVLLHSAHSDIHRLGQEMQVDRVVHKADDAAHLPEALRTLAR